ncbi:hypothetical protein [Jiella sp. M17.18]|uniref:hypothetical protein n=1 Tax=Jiella sp. M17.18 TaxID=3234247 RepID=UPI0034DE7A00
MIEAGACAEAPDAAEGRSLDTWRRELERLVRQAGRDAHMPRSACGHAVELIEMLWPDLVELFARKPDRLHSNWGNVVAFRRA